MADRLSQLHSRFGLSVWKDDLRREELESGKLSQAIEKGEIQGLTSNPTILKNAVEKGAKSYADLFELGAKQGQSTQQVYENIVVRDIRDAADAFKPVFEQTRGEDGYVSLEVSPRLAHDTQGTLAEARRLWGLVDRPNLMIKVPATDEGIAAVRQLISEGLNVNVTLLFAQEAYQKVAEAYLSGLEERAQKGQDVSHVASVASFFISRIDAAVDKLVAEKLSQNPGANTAEALAQVRGEVAIANAKQAYQLSQELSQSPRWAKLEKLGARPQRLLWASTGVKDPKFKDTRYVEELIGKGVVNTVPPATLEAFLDHGEARNSLTENVANAGRTMDALASAGISIKDVTDRLLDDGLKQFSDSFDQLEHAIEENVLKWR